MKVAVLSMRGQCLMPCSPRKARVLLREKKAVVKQKSPFTIQLTIPTGETKQEVTLGVDAGSKHIGISATTAKTELFASEVELRQDVTGLLADRRALRRSRRARKTRYRAPRFNNRVHSKHKGWLAPSIENRIQAHLSRIEAVLKLFPVTKIVIETASFDIQKIKNPAITGKGYQQGELLDFFNLREYILWRDNHTCQHCKGKSKDKVLQVHHLESRRTGGNATNNLITLCKTCHEKSHTGEITLNIKRGRSFKDAAFMNIMRPAFVARLRKAHPGMLIEETYGYITKYQRIKLKLPKTHCADAFCIAGNLHATRSDVYLYQKQTRKHNRQIHKVNAIKGGIRKLNQAPYIVKGFRLFDKVKCFGKKCYGKEGFIMGRRQDGGFDIRTIDGQHISKSVSPKKLKLIQKRKTFLTAIKKEGASSPV